MAAAVTRAHPGADVVQLQTAINHLDLIALSRLVAGVVDSLPSLASELHKPAPAVEVETGDVSCTSQFAEALKSSFMHMLRNSLDHGIEAPAERISANKPAQGRIRIACEQHGDRVELHISDDGRGLALQKLYDKGAAISIELPDPRGRELGFAPFEFVIALPPTALGHTPAEPLSELTRDVLEESARQRSVGAAAR